MAFRTRFPVQGRILVGKPIRRVVAVRTSRGAVNIENEKKYIIIISKIRVRNK